MKPFDMAWIKTLITGRKSTKPEKIAEPVKRRRKKSEISAEDHPLRGDFAGSRDCHIEPDWLLIYTLTENDSHVRFERTGTHSDLFR